MTAILTEVVRIIYIVGAFTLFAEDTDESGPEKRAQVVAEVEEILRSPEGVRIENATLRRVVTEVSIWSLGWLVDKVVETWENSGFFNKLSGD